MHEVVVAYKQKTAVKDEGGVDLKVTTELQIENVISRIGAAKILYNTLSGCPLLPQSGLQMHSIIQHNLEV